MIEVELKDDELQRVLERLSRAVTDMTPAMQDVGELLVDSTRQGFASGASPDGTPWAPKSQATIDAYRRREGKGPNARIDFRPLFGPTGSLSSTIFSQAGPTSVEWGSPMIYAAVMQFGAEKGAFGTMSNGSPIPWGRIPARPYLGLSDEDRSNIAATLEEWISDAGGARD
ncbi:phage virion morphogenesis protein [Litorisediminicola beolgyonensis]|uniref:Phage virion morphogenesis protein n=1 Tax=Litorisediminicola beolgyonensis TaxID=1173614 RepID=A0ABW3ZIE6_9RHOB